MNRKCYGNGNINGIPVVMVFLSQSLNYPVNRQLNLTLGLFYTTFTLNGTIRISYILLESVAIIVTVRAD